MSLCMHAFLMVRQKTWNIGEVDEGSAMYLPLSAILRVGIAVAALDDFDGRQQRMQASR